MSEVYKNPEGVFDRLVALTEEGVFIANPEPTQLDQWERALTDGSVLPAGDAQILPYGSIESVKANRHRDDFNIHYRDGSRTRLENVGFQSAAVRDRALHALHRRLGRSFRRSEVQYGLLRAAAWPLLAAVALGLFTYLAAGAAAEIAGGAPVVIRGRHPVEKTLFAGLLRVLGPIGISLVGSVCILAALVWLAGRLRKPPLMVTLSRSHN